MEQKKKKSLSTKISLWIVLFAGLIFIASLGVFFNESRKAVRVEALKNATLTLDKTVQHVNTILTEVKVATDNTDWLITRHLDAPDSMFVYSRRILQNNPNLNGCSIAFEPFYFSQKGLYFSAYSLNYDGNIQTTQEGNEHYQYFAMDWYQLPKLLDKPCWTEPFIDYNPDAFTSPEMIISYCKPIKDRDSVYIGTISVDLSLNWLSQTISAVKPYPNSYSIMIGQGGTYFVHPDTTKLFYQTIFTPTLIEPDSALTNLGHAMQAGEHGERQLMIDGNDCYVLYAPLADTGWSVGIVCPAKDIFSGYYRLINTVLGVVFVGLLLMLMIFSGIISKQLEPLEELAYQAETIASGRFDEELTETGRKDEIGQLSNSFHNMQVSLVKQMEELKQANEQKGRIEGELKIASDIQMSMLPKIFPPFPDRDDIDVFGRLTPAKEVGGDLFDFYIRDEKLFFCIGDVSGKGVPAALVMAVTRAQFRTISAHQAAPDKIVSNINDAMAADNESNMFVTLFIGVLDLLTGRLHYCNAGHDAPLLIGNTGAGMLPVDSNLPAGVMPGWKFTNQETLVDPGTTIFLYTDGLTEAENIEHKQFEMSRIKDLALKLQQEQTFTPNVIIDRMTESVHEFVGEADQSDDLTMLAIRYTKHHEDLVYQRSLTLINDLKRVPRLNTFIDEACEANGFDMATTMQINLAIEEAVVNVMNYAYPAGTKGDITIEAKANKTEMFFIISDTGTPFDPTAKAEVDITLSAEDRSIGGLGIHLIRQIMDNINYERVDGHNILTLMKKLNKQA
ncbi:MAG: SpoIIE family protein phosphatase [Bacteroidaceae bacterium]|nr:SpoIIE family protein phosphatase [Bacteroidaceae bacterium]